MFGTLRFILASLVVYSHLVNVIPGTIINIGVCAVIGFFLLSGAVMTHILHFHYPQIGRPTLYFYLDRALRIFPQFLLFMILSQISVLIFQFDSPFLKSEPAVHRFLLNVLLVPLNYSMYIPTIKHYLLLPQAWSLGLEEQFYWIFPFLVLLRWPGPLVALLSLITFGFAANGLINSEYFTFRFLPGVMHVFLMGKFLMEYKITKRWPPLLWAWALYFGVLVITFYPSMIYINDAMYKYAVGFGVLACFPMIFVLTFLRRRRWDDLIGNASYGIFLSHHLVIDSFRHFHITSGTFAVDFSWILGLSTLLGFAGDFLIERWITPIRYRLREKLCHCSKTSAN